MTARVDRLLRGSLGSVLVALGCSFNAAGLGEDGPGGGTLDPGTSSGGSGEASQSTGAPLPTGSEGGATDGTGDGSTTAPIDPSTGEPTSATATATTTTTATTTGDATTTTGDEPETSTTTDVEPSTSTGCAPQEFFKDDDKDGFGDPNSVVLACEAPDGYVTDNTDCNDGSDKANPAASEVCGGGDNDCDGLVDEYNPPDNVDCNNCKMFARDTKLYHFCSSNKKWSDAQSVCEGRNAVLAKDGDQGVHDWMMARLTDINAGSGAWWLGARTPDGNHANFEWRDLSKLGGFQPWVLGYPTFGNTDCVRVASPATPVVGGLWVDANCGDSRPSICEGPLP